jgi:hypothetical protein
LNGYKPYMAVRLPKALTKKRNALAYEQGRIQVRLGQVRDELRAIDYSIKLLDPAWRAPRKAHKPVVQRGLQHGQIARTCLEVLQVMPGISTPELADQVAEECGMTFRTPTEREDFASAVAMALRRHQRKGLLEVIGEHPKTGALKWRFCADGDSPGHPKRLS